tara:strand:+ start:578 stop:814 length:237 start_codon:yes stop_codon:yes gene_type:complete
MDLDFFSDLYKDVHGFRPRGIKPTPEMVNSLQRELKNQLAQERADEDASINSCMAHGAPDINTAMRWLEQANIHPHWV